MEENLSFDIVDKKVQYLLDTIYINKDLLKILENIIDKSERQSNTEYYNALEQFEKEYIAPTLN
jgi:hypothetical protein